MAAANRAREIFKPEFRFGLGGVPLGNEFNKITDQDAEATLDAAWAAGVRYLTCHRYRKRETDRPANV